ncbi:putative enzyme related to lactoylglutathione lyase [Kribbella rubisoli]|uniref:Enzyme related to lactoylglutathione lyase n=1 Tax=Kribbella rubisoli TaxID=3075929 RepID=A0A4Q7W010_9ACTN|nr:VOC family protein [Kribbella rubisoli]RZU01909.1 putative enzyme related to lactoylglutathione lyase [Kribbella rubisoli]
MQTRLEAVVVPVSDADRSRHFYRALGFRLDLDVTTGDGSRVVRLTPPGSTCSIMFGSGITTAGPCCILLTVPDIEAARAELVARGAAPGPVREVPTGVRAVSFLDPDENEWLLVESMPLNRP